MLELPALETLTEAQKDALIRELFSLVQGQAARIAELEAKIQELEARLKKDSRNSGKPPASDGLAKRPRNNGTSLRPKSGKKVGGQAGHEGHTLQPTDTPDRIEEHPPCQCAHCGHDLSDEPVLGHTPRQVYDLPELKLQVTEHRAQHKLCPHCQTLSQGDFPRGVDAAVQYGPRIKSLGVYLKGYQLLPYERQRELFADVFHHDLSVATLLNAEAVCYERLQGVDDAVRQAVVEAPVAHFDESGLRVEGQLRWLHTASTDTLTWYQVHAKRGTEALEEANILPRFAGVAVHDAWHSYFYYQHCTHGLCNAHHLREFKLMHEHYGQLWAAEMAALLRDIHRTVEKHRAEGKESLSGSLLQGFERCYDSVLGAALEAIPSLPDPPVRQRGRKKQHPAKNLHDRLSGHKQAVLRFMYDFRVPFDNNQAERDIRMIKAQQKISGTFRTFRGAQVFCRIRGYISTAKKQGMNVLEALRQTFEGNPWRPVTA
jgi:transposase